MKKLCWICERELVITNKEDSDELHYILPGENHGTAVCHRCIKKLKEGKNLQYIKIINETELKNKDI